MKKIVLAALLLGACATTPTPPDVIPPAMPDLPPSLAKKAKQLPPLTDPTMGGSQIDGARDDSSYNEIAWQVNRLIDVWNCTKTALKDKKDATPCFNTIK